MLHIEFDRPSRQYLPGKEVLATVSWEFEQEVTSIELRLVWNTVGKGDQNLSIDQTWEYKDVAKRDRKTETIMLPEGPYSFSSKLLSVVWAFEAIAQPSEETTREEFVMAPTGDEIKLVTSKALSSI